MAAGTPAVASPTVADVTLQQQFEQLEAAISEGHAALDRIQGVSVDLPGGNQAEPAISGAMATSQRCMTRMQELLTRLNEVANTVGQV